MALLKGVFWLAAAVGVIGAMTGVVLTVVMWPNHIGLVLAAYGCIHAVAFGLLAANIDRKHS